MNDSKELTKKTFDLQDRIRKAAIALNKLQNGAVAAFTGGAIVVGLVFGGIFWVPAAMSGSLILYRTGDFVFNLKNIKKQKELEHLDRVIKIKQMIHSSGLPQNEIKLLSNSANDESIIKKLPYEANNLENDQT